MLRRSFREHLTLFFRVIRKFKDAVEGSGRCVRSGSVDEIEDIDVDLPEELDHSQSKKLEDRSDRHWSHLLAFGDGRRNFFGRNPHRLA